MRRLGTGLLASVLATSAVAAADTPPSAWDRARDPAIAERYRLHERVQALMHPMDQAPQLRTAWWESARAELEAASAATSPDVRLRFDLGEVYEDLDRHTEALEVLTPALAMAPEHSAAPAAWLAYAFAAAKLDRSREEIAGYDAALAASPVERPTILSNRAEAEMRLGNLDAAIAGYREVIYLVEHSSASGLYDEGIRVLARWGLAVALDRNGDPSEAQQQALIAAGEDPNEQFIGDHESVFFVPFYERDWYYALGRTEHAKQARDPVQALVKWEKVVQTWADYVKRAAPNDRWLALARTHLASAEARRLTAASRVTPARRGPRPASSSRSGGR